MKIITLLLIFACTFTIPFKKDKGVGPRGFGPRLASPFNREFESKNSKSERPTHGPGPHWTWTTWTSWTT